VLVAITATGCTATTPEPTATATATPTPTPEVTPVAVQLAPLTGKTIAAGSLPNASIAAKIDNHSAARPQISLQHTDIVFEELVEGGLTRYVAVWQSKVPKELGPVRSIRPMDPDIVSPLGGIIAYSGGQQRFVDQMKATKVYNAVHGQADTASTFFRSTSKSAPHNVIVKAQDVINQHKDIAAPVQQFNYANYVTPNTAKVKGTPTLGISMAFSEASPRSWKWDAGKKAWLRSQDGGKDMDNSGNQLQATNVVVIKVPITTGLGVPKTELIGSGDALVATSGATVSAKWSKESATSVIKIVDGAGQPILLEPGNTWVELLPNYGSVKVDKAPVPTPAPTTPAATTAPTPTKAP